MNRAQYPPQNRSFGRIAFCDPRAPILIFSVAVLLTLAGCATSERPPDLTPVDIAQSIWSQVDRDIAAASLEATATAENYARASMEDWWARVRQRTETDFIAWFTGYWTQQWLAIKVAWYKLGSGDDADSAATRLASYLQQQYHDRVLDPVAKEIDPDAVRGQALTLYIKLLDERIKAIPRRYAVPQDRFDRHLKEIRAIALAPPHNASLHEIVHVARLASLPAYAALLERMRKAAGESGGAAERISPVAKWASEKLLARLAASGGASAAAAAVGGVPGLVISLGAAGLGVIAHESDRPRMEAQLRESLDAVLHDRWLDLAEDRDRGVMAGVYHIAGNIAASLAEAPMQGRPGGQ